MGWRQRAACQEHDPELWFPVGDDLEARQRTAAAKAVCRECPVIVECLDWAMASWQTAGIWGGLSRNERRVRRAAGNRIWV